MSERTDRWGAPLANATVNLVDALKAAKFAPDQGADIMGDVFADIIGQLDVGLPGFRKDVIVKLTLDEANTKRLIL